MGFFPDVPSLLAKLVADSASKKDTTHYSITSVRDSVVSRTNNDDGTKITFSPEILTQLARSRKLCHNDLEPRNLLVRVKEEEKINAGTGTSEALSTGNTTNEETTTKGKTAKDTTWTLVAILD